MLVGSDLRKMGPKGAGWGAAAPPQIPNTPIFCERAPLGFLTWPMEVFYEDKVIWFGCILVSSHLGPIFPSCVPLFPFAMCRMEMRFA